MVRKPIRTVDGLAATKLSYPETPSPLDPWSTGATGVTPREGHNLESPKELPCPDGSADGFDTTRAWATMSRQDRMDSLPATRELPAGGPGQTMKVNNLPREDSLPPSLRVGFADLTPRSSFESQRSANSVCEPGPDMKLNFSENEPYTQTPNSNNPYLRLKSGDNALSGDSNLDGDNSANIWATTSENNAQDMQVPAQRPLNAFGSEPFAEPWFDFVSTPTGQGSSAAPHLPKKNSASILNPYTELSGNPFEGLDAFEENQPARKEENNFANKMPSMSTENIDLQGIEGTHRNLNNLTLQHRVEAEGHQQPLLPRSGNTLPELPPRPSLEESDVSSVQQLRENPNGLASRNDNTAGKPNTNDTLQLRDGQRNETYQIRLVSWNDSVAPDHIRKSPIMVQNANGPCPLLALVNALTLSTPGDVETPLVETLKTREQISLGLLLDAVLDELMSGRRGDTAQTLPDVSDLYSFLITLHTGMNVNPLFVSSETKVTSLLDEPIFESPIESSTPRKPGGFEDTREMRLYSTFAIPLIHGWIPPRDHVALGALKRSARAYDEAQTLLFREEEIEYKLQHQGLTSEEQIMLEDVASVKYFLATSATQLTDYGLQCISESLRPGSIAILFRNDHFSTLYKHPQSGQLLTLVTDMGYAGHDEVVWESLVDVSGEGCEYFAGDFRPVGNVAGDTGSPSNHVSPDNNSGWSTVSRHDRSTRAREFPERDSRDTQNGPEPGAPSNGFSLLSLDEPVSSPLSSKAEQEDHDLALALQLQEEEEDRERRATAARRRQDQLSQIWLDAQPSSNRRASGRSERRGVGQSPSTSTSREQEIRPMVPPRVESQPRRKAENSNSEDAPPPTYEQAAKGPAYHPPADDPTPLHTPSPSGLGAERPPQMGPYCQHPAARVPGAFPTPRGRNFNSPSLVTSPATGQGSGNRRSRYDGGGGGSRRGDVGTGRGNPGEEDEKNCTLM